MKVERKKERRRSYVRHQPRLSSNVAQKEVPAGRAVAAPDIGSDRRAPLDRVHLPWHRPRFGLNLQSYPILDFVVELAFCIGCWKLFGGSRQLLIGIVVFNVINLPLMLPGERSFALLVAHPTLLPTLILIQVVATWLLVWWFGRNQIFLEEAVPATTHQVSRLSAPIRRA